MRSPTQRHPGSALARIALIGTLLIAALANGGCGFQPRGTLEAGGAIPSPLFVTGVSPYTDLYREFRHQLDAAGVPIAANGSQAAATLVISEWRRDSRVLSIDSRNRAVEYELQEELRFALRGPDGSERLPLQSEQALRIQYRPPTSVLGSENESEMLRDDMVRDLVGRVLRRIAAAP